MKMQQSFVIPNLEKINIVTDLQINSSEKKNVQKTCYSLFSFYIYYILIYICISIYTYSIYTILIYTIYIVYIYIYI